MKIGLIELSLGVQISTSKCYSAYTQTFVCKIKAIKESPVLYCVLMYIYVYVYIQRMKFFQYGALFI